MPKKKQKHFNSVDCLCFIASGGGFEFDIYIFKSQLRQSLLKDLVPRRKKAFITLNLGDAEQEDHHLVCDCVTHHVSTTHAE